MAKIPSFVDLRVRSLTAAIGKNIRKLVDESNESSKQQVKRQQDKIDELTNKLKVNQDKLTRLMIDNTKDSATQAEALSDPHRPTKLAEMLCELYDNQWTDAFEELLKLYDEEECIQKLLDILMTVNGFCREKSNEHIGQLKQVVYMRNIEEDPVIASIKGFRKQTAELSIQYLCKDFSTKHPMLTKQALTWKYVEECIKLCWWMSVQDPAVVFHEPKTEHDKFNTDLYKPYTRSGETIHYLVWPPLLVHEEGPVIAKGVAQGY